MVSALTPTQIGDISEAIVRARFIEKGYVVLVPQNSGLRYDIVVEKDGVFQRIQVKTGRIIDEGIISFRASSVDPHTRVDVPYHGEIDAFAVYCPQNRKTYLVPIAHAPSSTCTLRLTPTKNNQTNGIRWAEDYEF